MVKPDTYTNYAGRPGRLKRREGADRVTTTAGVLERESREIQRIAGEDDGGNDKEEAWHGQRQGHAILQDGPPPGGFAPVRYARRIPTKGPSAMAIFLAAVGAFSWGMYQVGQGNKIRRRSALEDMVLYVWISKFRALKCGEILGNVQ
ncbi:NADH dehydrogenase [ubiquinone] 1 alpha subcomplex subunit 13-A [Vitis vinifera]|uniref:NADH dehydrogenase [ubiquinone] 1 alpha subcomplex subunit 13 n=1 Tax=Vitis vinifera TaxID=29760 RepID=A0A438KDV9_VITVI|nr:NADH dehydrogenase [ubiquinone] 1 alpha subcomplex subunit 13-A [Vitis vinifera]